MKVLFVLIVLLCIILYWYIKKSKVVTTTTTTTATKPINTTTTTLSPVFNPCLDNNYYQVSLRYESVLEDSACTGNASTYYLEGSPYLKNATGIYIIFKDKCVLAPSGYYSDNVNYRKWSGLGWSSSLQNCNL